MKVYHKTPLSSKSVLSSNMLLSITPLYKFRSSIVLQKLRWLFINFSTPPVSTFRIATANSFRLRLIPCFYLLGKISIISSIPHSNAEHTFTSTSVCKFSPLDNFASEAELIPAMPMRSVFFKPLSIKSFHSLL